MKRILFLLISLLMLMLLQSCCSSGNKPPRRAIYSQTSGYGMQYHIILYQPSYRGGTHIPTCGSWEYSPFHVFTDKLGKLKGNDVIIKSLDMAEPPYVDHGQNLNDISLMITKKTISISGVKGGVYNGTYTVETSSPDSWGVPIVKGKQLPNQ